MFMQLFICYSCQAKLFLTLAAMKYRSFIKR